MTMLRKSGRKQTFPLNTGSELHPFKGLVSEPVFSGKVYFQTRGNPAGPVVFLVHGLDDNASKIWQETIDTLARDYFVATLDLPGFGQSSKSNKPGEGQ